MLYNVFLLQKETNRIEDRKEKSCNTIYHNAGMPQDIFHLGSGVLTI